MSLLFDLALMTVGTVLLLYGADWFLDGVRDLSRALGISMFVLGIVLVGLEPEEMLASALASGRGASELALGNVIGTNVTIVTLALGLSALISPIIMQRGIRRQALIATLVSLVPIALLFTGVVSRLEGALLLVLFIGYTFFLVRTDRAALERIMAAEDDDDDDDDDDEVQPEQPEQRRGANWRAILLTAGGLLAMTAGGYGLVEGAVRLVAITGLSEGVVGATLVSLATSAEMVILGVKAARKGQSEVLVGGILGSFAYNLLVTLGLAAVVRPLPVNWQQIFIPLLVMIVAHLGLLLLIWRGRIGRWTGAILVAIYIAYLAATVVVRLPIP